MSTSVTARAPPPPTQAEEAAASGVVQAVLSGSGYALLPAWARRLTWRAGLDNVAPFMGNIESTIQSYFGALEQDEHHRYRSWEHCYRYFQGMGPSGLAKDRHHAAIQLGFFLASWGMYRGGSFLLQRAYTAHLPAVDCLCDPRWAPYTCVLSKPPTYAMLRKLERASAGRTADGILIHDIRVTIQGEGYTSYALPQPELTETLKRATDLASKLNPRASQFFSLGLAEKDQLKRFLYFFLALEVETHATFKRIDHAAGTHTLLAGSGIQGQRAAQLLETLIKSLKNLSDRFVWCATCVWSKLEQSDIEQFKRLKKVRDDIAHGNEAEPPHGSALEAEHLVRKILWDAR